MAKKLGKKARKFAHKHLQGGAKRSRKLRSQFNRRTRKGPFFRAPLPAPLLAWLLIRALAFVLLLIQVGRAGRTTTGWTATRRCAGATPSCISFFLSASAHALFT